jgi:hypothetical protein
MVLFKEQIVKKINEIISLDDAEWNKLDLNIKLKYIHHFCSNIENDTDKSNDIPLKSLKPKKIIQYCGISNINNKHLYCEFNKLVLNYTNEFRNKYINVKKKQYFTNTNLPKEE